ncbi:hypothetical protein LROSL3_1558 [Furfurilactobacillus rossiae]|nr:hypothetical protein LROSL2_1557 [Furfurilactobacillus rossiae]QLE69337.1 hypothetical protein LROSL3_1558 [Furfurilactobacillus rossiae]
MVNTKFGLVSRTEARCLGELERQFKDGRWQRKKPQRQRKPCITVWRKKQGNKREKIKEDQILVFLKMIIYLSSLSNFFFALSTVSLTASLASDSLSLALPRIP